MKTMLVEMDFDFDLYATSDGLSQVSNPVKRQILVRLSEKDMSLTEMSSFTGKAQSTLSVHLDRMVSDGLITEREDPSDNRRKLFSLSARHVANSRNIDREGVEKYYKTIESTVDDEFFFKSLMRSAIIGAEASGIYIGPTMFKIGSDVGAVLSSKIKSERIEDIISEIQEFYEKKDLGEVCVYTFMPLTIIVRDNYDVTPCAARSISMFSQGLFTKVLEKITKKSYKITSSECFGASNNYFKFIVEQIR